MKKRILSTALALVMIFSLLPANTASLATLATSGDPSDVGAVVNRPSTDNETDIGDNTTDDNTAPADPAEGDPAEGGAAETDDTDPGDDADANDLNTDMDDTDANGDTDPTETDPILDIQISAAPASDLTKFPVKDIPAAPADWMPIADADGLKAIKDDPNGSYYLTADIDLEDAEWAPLDFYGQFDGQGYVIKNFKITAAGASRENYGLFGAVSNAAISNVGVENVNINVTRHEVSNATRVGAVCGYAIGSTISNCYSEDITVAGTNSSVGLGGSLSVGGIVGAAAQGSAVNYCLNSGNVTAAGDNFYTRAGGICGYVTNSAVENCTNKGDVAATNANIIRAYAGGIVGEAYDGVAVNACDNEGAVSAASTDLRGGTASAGGIGGYADVCSLSACTNKGSVTATVIEGGAANAGGIGGSIYFVSISGCANEGAVSAATTETDYLAGSDQANAGGIAGYAAVYAISACTNKGPVEATSAICNAHAGGMGGRLFDGLINDCTNEAPVAASLTGDAGENTSRSVYAGGIGGDIGESDITACTNNGAVTATNSATASGETLTSIYAGGICGFANVDVTVKDCTNESMGIVTAVSTDTLTLNNDNRVYAGGVCGHTENNTVVEDCANAGAVTLTAALGHEYSTAYAAGVVGYAGNSTVSDCANTGGVTVAVSGENSRFAYAGGVFGYVQHTTVNKATNTGEVGVTAANTEYAYAGGIGGNAREAAVSDCANMGKVSVALSGENSRFAYAGGVCGEAGYSTVSKAANTGLVTATAAGASAYAGGVCGYARDATVNDCSNGAAVTAEASGGADSETYAGGVCGFAMYTTVSHSYNTGAASSENSVRSATAGGICGKADYYCVIRNCYNTGAVSAVSVSQGAYAGGVCGDTSIGGAISNCYSSGSVAAKAAPGYSAYAGGVCGDAKSGTPWPTAISACYWNSDSSQTVNDALREAGEKLGVGASKERTGGLASNQMKTTAAFVGFDFARIWTFVDTPVLENSGYPVLRAFYPGLVAVTGISLDSAATLAAAGATATLTATVSPANASYQGLVWEAADEKVATVEPAAAGFVTVTATGAGLTMIVARSVLNPTVSATCWVTVGAEPSPVPSTDGKPKLPVSAISLNKYYRPGTAFTILPANPGEESAFDKVEIVSAVGPRGANSLSSFEALAPVGGSSTRYSLVAKTGQTAPANGKHTLTLQAKKGAANLGNPVALTVTVTATVPRATIKLPTLNTFWKASSGKAGGIVAISGASLPAIKEVALDPELAKNFDIKYEGGACTITAKNNDGFANKASNGKPIVKGKLTLAYVDFTEPVTYNVTIPCKETPPKLALSPATQTINTKIGLTAKILVQPVDGSTVTGVAPKANASANKVIESIVRDSENPNLILVTLNEKAKATNKLSLDVSLEGAVRPVTVAPTIKTTQRAATYSLSPATVTVNIADYSISRAQYIRITPSAANTDSPPPRVSEIKAPANTGVDAQNPENSGVRVKEWSYAEYDDLFVEIPWATKPGTYTFKIKLVDVSKELSLKVKVSRQYPTASVKAVGKGNIDLMDRAGSQRVLAPTIKNSASGIAGVRLEPSGNYNSDSDFMNYEVEWDGGSGCAVVKLREDAAVRRGASHKVKLVFSLHSGQDAWTGAVTLKPTQSKPKHSFAPVTFFQSRVGMNSHQVIDVAPTAPAGARVTAFSLTKGNENGAFGSYYDLSNQQLHIWLTDGNKVTAGKKMSLTFSAVYEGQGFEGSGAWKGRPKPGQIKIPVTIGR
ncbi:MAG: Ig-like domain-containing protein [Lachnospiraceae bacterium]|nr:Ig-like domain-containing protein [Lachnospiraceae bacterium]